MSVLIDTSLFWAYDHFCKYSFTASLVVLVVILMTWYKHKRYVAWKNLPPGRSGWPIIGETLDFIMDGNKYMRERIARYGPVFRSSILGQNMIIISGAENVKTILLGEGTTVQIEQPDSVRALIGQGTLYSTLGTAHNEMHKFVSKTFHHDNLREITPHVHSIIRDFVAKWRRNVDVTSGVAEVKRLAFTLSANALLGMDFSSEEIDCVISSFEAFNDAFFSFPLNLPGFAYHKGKRARKQLLDLIGKNLAELPHKPKDRRLHLMRDLMERHLAISSELDENSSQKQSGDLKNMALELAFGSHATISSCLCTVLMYLGNQTEVFDRVHQELEESQLCQRSRHDDVITYDDVKSMTYVQNVVKEVLRISPPIAGSFRRTIQPIKVAGYDIPKGWCILYHVTFTHRLSPLFADQRDCFQPERWQMPHCQVQSHNSKNKTRGKSDMSCEKQRTIEDQLNSEARFHYIPFGAGQRRCVGKEFAKLVLRLFVMETVRTGRWHLVNGFPEIKTCPIVYPKDKLLLQFEKN